MISKPCPSHSRIRVCLQLQNVFLFTCGCDHKSRLCCGIVLHFIEWYKTWIYFRYICVNQNGRPQKVLIRIYFKTYQVFSATSFTLKKNIKKTFCAHTSVLSKVWLFKFWIWCGVIDRRCGWPCFWLASWPLPWLAGWGDNSCKLAFLLLPRPALPLQSCKRGSGSDPLSPSRPRSHCSVFHLLPLSFSCPPSTRARTLGQSSFQTEGCRRFAASWF